MIWQNFKWPKEAFKNFYAYSITLALLYCIYDKPELRDVSIAVLIMVVKHYFDNNASSNKKDETINSMANSIPDAPKSQSNEK